jgi:hypothetical protein
MWFLALHDFIADRGSDRLASALIESGMTPGRHRLHAHAVAFFKSSENICAIILEWPHKAKFVLNRSIVYTRDIRVPLSADDLGMENGWRCIPIPPTADDDWVVVDNRSDRKTGWARRSQIMVCETGSMHRH